MLKLNEEQKQLIRSSARDKAAYDALIQLFDQLCETSAADQERLRTQENEGLLAAAHAIFQNREFEEIVRSIFTSAKQLTSAAAGFVLVMNEAENAPDLLLVDEGELPNPVDPTLPAWISGLREMVYSSKQVIYDNHFAESEWASHLSEGHLSLENVLLAPLLPEDKVVGMIGLSNKTGGFSENDVRLVSAFAELAVVALRNHRLLQALQKSENRLRTLIDLAPVGIFETDAQGRYSFVNQQWSEISGTSFSDIAGAQWGNTQPEEIRAMLHEAWDTAQSEKRPLEVEFQMRRLDGSSIWIQARMITLHASSGKITGQLGILNDISRYKQAENQLRFLSQLLNSVKESVIATDLAGMISYWGKGAEIIYGYVASEAIGRHITFLAPPDQVEAEHERIRHIIKYGAWQGQDEQVRQDGTRFWSDTFISLVTDSRDLPWGMIGISRDITIQRLARLQLQENEQKFRAFVEQSIDGIVLINSEGRIVEWNDAQAVLTGYSAEDALGEYIWTVQEFASLIDDPEELQRHTEHSQDMTLETLRGGKAPWLGRLNEQKMRHRDGSERVLQTVVFPINTPHGLILGSISRDVTATRQMEQQVRVFEMEKERMQILSDFVTNASHEFRTPLTIIQTLQHLLNRVDDPEKRAKYTHNTLRQIKRINWLVENLTKMAQLDRAESLSMGSFDLNGCIRQAVHTVEGRSTSAGKLCSMDFACPSLMLQGHEEYLNQALIHILDNAFRYTPKDRTITVHTEAQPQQAIIEIRDTGIGISQADLPHVFERFFRVDKAHSTSGFGLGLSIAKRIIDLHQGQIKIESQINQGSTVTIILPRKDD